MKSTLVIALAALCVPFVAAAHPGHGTAPASEPGKAPHVHFGAAGTPTSGLASRISGTKAKKPGATHTVPAADKAQRRERER